jgi:mannose-6-phosphate isomerase-like protein (cupin superfamily)
MKRLRIDPQQGFRLVAATARSQAATLVLAPGHGTGGPDNRHPASDQWLYVLAGEGRATVAGEEVALRPGVLVLIEAGEAHQIVNGGSMPLKTLSIYAPPAF